MRRRVLFILLNALVWSCITSVVFSQAKQPDAVEAPTARSKALKQRAARWEHGFKVRQLQSKLASGELDKDAKEKAVVELREAVESKFDFDTQEMKTLIANTQAGVKQRVANREELIRTRIEKLLDMPEAGEIGFKITDIEKKPDGTSIAKVTLFRHERGTRMATVLEIVKEQRVRTVDGQEQTFTVEVPKKRMVKQFAMKKVPVREEDVPIPAGADAEETVKNFVDKKVSTEVDF